MMSSKVQDIASAPLKWRRINGASGCC
jgi:hypothetical protein